MLAKNIRSLSVVYLSLLSSNTISNSNRKIVASFKMLPLNLVGLLYFGRIDDSFRIGDRIRAVY
jgi:hypothetical protein